MNVIRKTATAVALIAPALILSALPTVGLGQSNTRPTLTFTCITKAATSDEPEGFRAVILVMDEKASRRLDLSDRYEHATWQYAARAKSKPEVWAIAQFGRAGLGPDLEIAHSLDDGRTWRHHLLTKKSRYSEFESFSMDRNGRGSVTIRLQDSPEPEHRDGYYTYTTRNNGRTWSGRPRYSKTAPTTVPTTLEQIPISDGPCLEPASQTPSSK